MWLSEAKQYGRKVVTIEFYFTIITKLSIKELLQEETENLKQEKAWIKVKRTRDEHTKKVGFLSGTIIQMVNMEWYERTLLALAGIEKEAAEFRKEVIFEGEEKQLCITMYSVESEAAKVDFNLRKLSAEEKSHIKYVSFKNNNRNERVSGLKLNQLINTRLKYEWLEDVSLFDKAKYQGTHMTISQILMRARANETKLFNGIEQGRGKYENRLYLYFKPNLQSEVNEWIQENYGQKFKIVNKIIYKTSIREITQEEKTMNKANTDYILERLKEIEIEEKSTKTYSQVVKQNVRYDQEEEDNSTNSDDETCITSNKSTNSPLSYATMTEASDTTKQERMQIQIVDLQIEMAKILARQEKLDDYIVSLEDSLESLTEYEVGSKDYKKAHKRVA